MTRNDLEVPPDPGALIESMRAFGYSLPTAIADLVDNSITAGARSIDVRFDWLGLGSRVAVVDDGHGMDEAELTNAMRLGSRSPVEARAANDLGRFGLGLKSAAWSQGRVLTVVTKRADGAVHGRRWDLDHVATTRRWMLQLADGPEVERLSEEIEAGGAGTAVLLEGLDRFVGDAAQDDEQARKLFLRAVDRVEQHLQMVFHRFLSGPGAVTLSINRRPIEGWDPFLESHSQTQRLQIESLPLDGRLVRVAPFVLPHVSKLTEREHAAAAGPAGWNAQQGFYVYRARRLLVAGGWLGLPRMQREEHCKLARIRVDLDNGMDEAWQIDVRKSTARIPGALSRELERIAKVTRRSAIDVYRFRGKQLARNPERQQAFQFIWERVMGRNGAHWFRLNRKHPIIQSLCGRSDEVRDGVERALRFAEENLPIEAIVLESREHPEHPSHNPFGDDVSELARMLADAHRGMVELGIDPVRALRALASAEPFDAHPDLIQALLEVISE